MAHFSINEKKYDVPIKLNMQLLTLVPTLWRKNMVNEFSVTECHFKTGSRLSHIVLM